MESLQTIIILMSIAAILVGIAQKIRLPYPIALILGGTAIGFFMPRGFVVSFDPNLILIVVLPPILYYAAFGISFREFKKNRKTIFSLALGLVFVTTFVVGVIFKWIFPEFSWALAFAFGAIVSPPDAIAATTILKRFAIGNRLQTVLEGESLINDASALVLYKLAVTALLAGTFSLSEGTVEFIKIVVGGVIVGAVLGIFMQRFSRAYLDPISGVVFSFTIPYVTYILANLMDVSGVLAVVVNGLIGAHLLPRHQSSQRRILGYAAWDIFTILLNCFVFILIGLQLRALSSTMTGHQMILLSAYGLLITLAMILVRLFWVYSKSCVSYYEALRTSKAVTLCPQILQDAALIGWSGMRGIVSLTAALALPLTLQGGTPLNGREEVIFITFIVILLTLLIPGFTLPMLIRWLEIPHQTEHPEAHQVRQHLANVAKEKIQHLYSLQSISQDDFAFLNTYFSLQHRILELSTSTQKELQDLELFRLHIIQEQRKNLLEMWERLEVDDKLLTHLEHELDVEETRIARIELK